MAKRKVAITSTYDPYTPSDSAKWGMLKTGGGALLALCVTLGTMVAGIEAYKYLDWPIPASRQWVVEANRPITTTLERIDRSLQRAEANVVVSQKRSRMGAIKDLLIENENKIQKATTRGEQKRLELQAKEWNAEWMALEGEIRTLERTKP